MSHARYFLVVSLANVTLLRSDGYEIERQIHGPKAQYNQISRWNHQQLLTFLSPSPDANAYPSNAFSVDIASLQNHKSYRVSTQEELDKLLNNEEFAKANVIQLVEIVMPRVSVTSVALMNIHATNLAIQDDAPRALLTQAKLSAKANEGS